MTKYKLNKHMEEGTDYRFDVGADTNLDDAENTPIVLLKGVYKDVTIRFNTVKFMEPTHQGAYNVRMKFDYDVIDPGSYTPEGLKQDGAFNAILGNIIFSILKDNNDQH